MNVRRVFAAWRAWLWTLVWFALPALLTAGLWKAIFLRSPFLLFLVGVVMATLRAGRLAGVAVTAGAALLVYYLQRPLTPEATITSVLTLAAMILIACLLDAAQRGTVALRDRDIFENRMGDAVSDFVWSCDVQGRFTFANQRHLDYVGLSLEQLQNAGWHSFIHPDDVETLDQHFAEANRRRLRYECEIRYRAADGSYRWFVCRGAPIQDERDEVVRWIGTSTDVHKRKEAEVEVKTAQSRLSLALEHARMGEWNWNAATDLVQLSARAEEILHLPAGGAHRRADLFQNVHEQDRSKVHLLSENSLRAQGRFYDAEYRLAAAPEEPVCWVSAKGRGVYAGDGTLLGTVGIVQDISERKGAEQAREDLLKRERQSRDEAERTNRMKDEFLATLSHELRTPLNAILGWAQLLKGSTDNPREVAEAAEVIERNTRAQARLVEDLLDMSRIISGKIRLDLREIALPELIRASREMVAKAAEARNIRISEYLPEMPRPLYGDGARLQQVLSNLLGNAVKFTPAGGTVEILVENLPEQVKICIKDSGIGIAPEFLPHVFDRFRQADAGSDRHHSGLGLGLSIVKNLVELHRGSITCSSPGVGGGSVFCVELPLGAPSQPPSQAEPVAEAAVAEPLPVQAQAGAGQRVLIVDDHLDSREVVRRVLQNNGAEVSVASSAPEALELLRGGKFDLLISDIGMPGMDGFEFIRRVRAEPGGGGHIPAIALTAFARAEDRERALTAGFDRFHSKPVEPGELLAAIASLQQARAIPAESHSGN